jgi:hypothetical protein
VVVVGILIVSIESERIAAGDVHELHAIGARVARCQFQVRAVALFSLRGGPPEGVFRHVDEDQPGSSGPAIGRGAPERLQADPAGSVVASVCVRAFVGQHPAFTQDGQSRAAGREASGVDRPAALFIDRPVATLPIVS